MKTQASTYPRQSNGVVIALCLLVFFVSPPFTVTCANEDGVNDQTALLTIPRQLERGDIPVFDNAVLDKLFSSDRVIKAEENKNQSEGENINPAAPPNAASTRTIPRFTQAPTKPNESLIAGITRRTSAKQAAALRLAEKSRKLLQSGEHDKALVLLEKALALDSSPYVYFYIARVHYNLGHYEQSLSFLEVAESRLTEHPDWMTEIALLKGESLHATQQGARYASAR